MKRIYFLSPHLKSTKSIIAELKHDEISEEDIYVVGKDHMQLQEAQLHQAGLFQTTDVLHALERGAVAGASIGLLSGLGIMIFPTGLVIGGGAVVFPAIPSATERRSPGSKSMSSSSTAAKPATSALSPNSGAAQPPVRRPRVARRGACRGEAARAPTRRGPPSIYIFITPFKFNF